MTIAETKARLREKMKIHFGGFAFRGRNVNDVLITLILGGADLDALRAKVVKAKADYDAALAAIDSIEDVDILDKFKTDSDAKMATFVGSKVKTDITTDQALAISRAIQAAKR